MTHVIHTKAVQDARPTLGLEKTVKDKEMKVIVRMNRKHKEVDGKESEFLVRKRVVPPQKIRRYMEMARNSCTCAALQSNPAGEVFHPLS